MSVATADVRALVELAAMRVQDRRTATVNPFAKYAGDAYAYAIKELKVRLTDDQERVARALSDHQRVMVRASHSVGKTHISGGLVNWWFDTFDPSICITTAPTDRQVNDLLWKEVRIQRRGRPGLLPKAPRMESGPDHYAVGFTARDVNAFQGTHEERLLIIFDEAVGIGAEFWEGADAMLTSGEGNRFLAIYNPTDTASPAYDYELSGDAEVITISALDHPNIAYQLAGKPKPFPKAIDLSWVDERVRGERAWCTPLEAASATTDDLEWPPDSGVWYRPGPLFESRVLGRWPSQAINSVWSESAFAAAVASDLDEPDDVPCEIGCDVARYGDDDTAMHVRRGPVSLHHESHNGWSTAQTAGRLKQLANEYGGRCGIDGRRIQVKIDDDGVGGGVVDQADGYWFEPVGAGTRAVEEDGYPNRRSELWFVTADLARRRRLSFARLAGADQRELRRQCMAPTWKVDNQGRRVVEPKEQTKKRLGRSPDDMDAVNLAYAFVPPAAAAASDTSSVLRTYGADRRAMSRFGGVR